MVGWYGHRSVNSSRTSTGPQGQAAIVGLGMTEMVRTPTKPALELAADAVRLACADAGVALGSVDGLLVNPADPSVPGIFLQRMLGLTDLRVLSQVQQFGSSAAAMVQYASLAIAAGMATTIACVFTDTPIAGTSQRYSMPRDLQGLASYEQASGLIGANPRYALAARRHMHAYGTTTTDFGAVAVAQRRWAMHNPLALARSAMDLTDHATSRMVADPFRLLDICFVCNGAIAVLVTASDRAEGLRQPPVRIWGWGQSHPGVSPGRGSDFGLTTGAVQSGSEAFAMAQVNVGDVTMCQIYDCYTYTVIVSMEDYGFCEKGEGGAFVSSGITGPGGALPTNTGGGQLSGYYMWGMTPLSEAIIQARGHGGGRQVDRNDVILVSGNGGVLDFHSTLIVSPHTWSR